MLLKIEKDRENISALLQQYSASVPNYPPGGEEIPKAIDVDYSDSRLTKKQRMEAQLASLKVKRRTRFDPLPRRVQSVMAIQPLKIDPKPDFARSVHGASVDAFGTGQGSKFGLRLFKENASAAGPAEKSILDYEDHELTPGH